MKIYGAFLGLLGLAAFLVPLQHPGPYGIPGRGLVGGTLCLAIAALLWVPSIPTFARRIALAVSPFALIVALYGAMAEAEEVIVLYAGDTDLRLWVVDHEGEEWVSMPRVKAETNALDGARLTRLRHGEVRCTVPRLVEDAEADQRTFALRDEKYAVQRLARLVGLFGDGPSPAAVTLRLDPCD